MIELGLGLSCHTYTTPKTREVQKLLELLCFSVSLAAKDKQWSVLLLNNAHRLKPKPQKTTGGCVMERCRCCLVVVAILSLSCGEGESLEEGGGGGRGLLPSGILRDDILFEIAWPGLESETDSKLSSSEYDPQRSDKSRSRDDQDLSELDAVTQPDSLLPESRYDEARYVDIRTDKNEQYHCVLPEINSFKMDQVGVASS